MKKDTGKVWGALFISSIILTQDGFMSIIKDGFKNHCTDVINQSYLLMSYEDQLWRVMKLGCEKFYNSTNFNWEMVLLDKKVPWVHNFAFVSTVTEKSLFHSAFSDAGWDCWAKFK